MDLKQLAKRVDDTANANGWDPSTWDNLPTKIMMTVTELDEARDFIAGLGDDPIEEELADVAIRLMSLLHGVFPGEWHAPDYPADSGPPFENIEVSLWRILGPLCKAVESWRTDGRADTCGWLEIALRETFHLASQLGIGLRHEIIQKDEKNKKRGQLHGKSRSAG